jgi:glyoxylase-like metal-dependent hydrolase (beta-lactamase superfamily II)
MLHRIMLAGVCVGLLVGIGWLGRWAAQGQKDGWVEVAPGVWRAPTKPGHATTYALIAQGKALLIDAADLPPEVVVEGVLLTHHHRDGLTALAKLPPGAWVRAAKESAEWLLPERVTKFWRDSIPLRSSRTSYFVLPEGSPRFQCDLVEGNTIEWRGFTVETIATPGHSRDHLAFAITTANDPRPIIACGDALLQSGKLWTPFTTDWDHWTDAGLRPAAESLRKLAQRKPRLLLPAHGPPIRDRVVEILHTTSQAIDEVGFLKSYERYTKERLGDAPEYPFLVEKWQVGSAGDREWSRVSEHLWITGNTYVLTSQHDRAFLVVDPWGERAATQIAKLKAREKLGPLEVVLFSHAHYDHFDGVYFLPNRDSFVVWSLDQVAGPLAEPLRSRAPFLDARPIRFDRTFRDGDEAQWREYRLRFIHLPGQSHYSMGVLTEIDGKRCLFTADNFFHHDQYSGTGGWMGLNRSTPRPYAQSAKKVLDLAPDWVLAEHGGPFVFNAEDFRRRVRWGEEAARAADAVCVSGFHQRDWDIHRVTFEPVLQSVRPGGVVKGMLVLTNHLPRADEVEIHIAGRHLLQGELQHRFHIPAQRSIEVSMRWKLAEQVPPGRHIFPIRASDSTGHEQTDAFLAVDVPTP